MKTNFYLTRLTRRCFQLLCVCLLTVICNTVVRAQTPYVTIISGSTCYGQSANLAILNATATGWNISPFVPGGLTNTTSAGATINAIATGTFTLTVTYINGPPSQPTGTLTLETTIENYNPTVDITSANTACLGAPVTFYPWVNGSGNYFYSRWYVDNVLQTTTYNGAAFTTSSLSAGTHTIRCEASPSSFCYTGPAATFSKTITITPAPTVSSNVSICAGESTTLNATGSTSYTWAPATGLNTTTCASVVASPAATTIYTVTYGSCSPPQQVTVTVNQRSAIAGSPCAPPSGTSGGSFSGTSNRNRTPVVLDGSKFSATPVNSFAATDLLGFIYNGSTWVQVPLQVDEKKNIDAGTIYQTPTTRETYSTIPYSTFTSSQYCDANTHVGADGNSAFDSDDEVVFMARDAGGSQAPVGTPYPTGAQASAGALVTLTDPNSPSTPASYLYIFKKASGSSLQQSAGRSYVNYDFKFKVGATTYGPSSYKTNYTFFQHLESSTVTTPYYQIGFSDRWLEDMVKITVGNSATIDLVDRHRNQFLINDCTRTENSFNTCAGAYIINKAGPIRGIRSHMGACSGPLTQRDFFFYDQFEVIKTNLRVHAIPGMMDFWDYNPGVGQLRYSNNNNTTGGTLDSGTGQTGIPIDGVPDPTVAAGQLTWQMVSSASGSIFKHYNLEHNISPISVTSYYLDKNAPSTNSTDPEYQCPAGDNKAWGSSGMYINQSVVVPAPNNQLPNTDPRLGGSYYARLTETNLFLKPSTSRSEAAGLQTNVTTPLTAVVTRWPLTGGRPGAVAHATTDTVTKYADPVSIYPNPSNGIFTIEAKGTQHDRIKLVVYNAAGREVYRTEATGSITKVVDLQAPQGTGKFYVAKIHIGSKVHTRKLMVNK